jgi:CRP/FNR family transcriptional regulator
MLRREQRGVYMKMPGDFGHLDVLNSIPAEHKEAILGKCTTRHYRKGVAIYNPGDRSDFVAIVGKGQAITLYHAPNGRVGASGIWTLGDILGASYIHNPVRRQTMVRSIEPITLFCLPHVTMHSVMRQYPAFGETMLKAVSARLRWAHNLTHIMQTLPAFERVCAILVSLSDRYGIQTDGGVLIEVSLTHEHLAALVGVTRQFATVTLHALIDHGLISLRNRRIVLHDPRRLSRLGAIV